MEITVGLFLLVFILAFICEFIDSSMGMGYGTILTPVLLIMGFDPLMVIPSILLSQAFGGFSASIFHHQFHNATFNRKSEDFKIFLYISGFGIIATIFAALLSINLPKSLLKSYIGLLVLIMGVIVLYNHTFTFSLKKMIAIGVISAFNKGLSGGGFGPVVTGGQIISGQNHRNAIGITTLAEAPICMIGFFTFIIGRTVQELNGQVLNMPFSKFTHHLFAPDMFSWELLLALLLGSVFVTPFGAFTTKVINKKILNYIIGITITLLGIWTLYKTWL
ncbi:MAG: sulfite exporter TauE/SafE family protein [Calditrichaceae bacterium]|jgi:uncharacterized protein